MNRQKRYDAKCKFVTFRFRKDKDEKYIRYLDECENKTEFLREAIDMAKRGQQI